MNPFPSTETQKEQYFKAFDRERWGFLGWGTNRFRNALKQQIAPVLEGLQTSISVAQSRIESVPREPIEAAFRDVYGKVGGHFANEIYSSFKSTPVNLQTKQSESDFERFIREWVQINGASRVVAITGTTRRRLRIFLEQSIEEGLGIEETARLLSRQQGIVGMQRARVIARTEIISASNRGSLHGAEQTNLNLDKEWISTRDGRTRRIPEDKTDHFTIDGQVQRLDKPFEVPHKELGTEFLNFPGDPSGRPETVIQCRCTQAYKRATPGEPIGLN